MTRASLQLRLALAGGIVLLLTLAAAQMGGIHLSDTRAQAVDRLRALLAQAHARGVRFVVFPELALTTFFPRYWFEDQREVDERFFEPAMPSPVTQPLFDARDIGWDLIRGYNDLTLGAVERIKCVEELLLSSLLASDKLNVIYQ